MRWPVIPLFIVLLPLSFLLAISLGATSIAFGDTLQTIFGINLADSEHNIRADLVITQIRLPRAILAALVGALLGICGATTQGLFRNPLADPSLIGVTAGASAGAAITIFFASSVAGLQGLGGIG